MNAFGKFVLFSEALEKEYIWSLGKSPVNTRELCNMLMNYTVFYQIQFHFEFFVMQYKGIGIWILNFYKQLEYEGLCNLF
jgi:hypothetical protein